MLSDSDCRQNTFPSIHICNVSGASRIYYGNVVFIVVSSNFYNLTCVRMQYCVSNNVTILVIVYLALLLRNLINIGQRDVVILKIRILIERAAFVCKSRFHRVGQSVETFTNRHESVNTDFAKFTKQRWFHDKVPGTRKRSFGSSPRIIITVLGCNRRIIARAENIKKRVYFIRVSVVYYTTSHIFAQISNPAVFRDPVTKSTSVPLGRLFKLVYASLHTVCYNARQDLCEQSTTSV